jgi:serine/threonine protein kinase
MTEPFKPDPGDTLVLFGEPMAFPQHPSARIRMPNSAEGGRATVYELRDPGGRRLALKVFRLRYREPGLAQSGARLTGLRALQGMNAAQRQVLLPGDDIVRRFPDLEYALLMPWIDGETWTEVMMRGAALPAGTAIHLCARFLSVMRDLETAGAAHTDIAGGNVVVQQDPIGVQLLDLEDMYLAGAPRPANPRPGSDGYQHRLREPVFCPEGDRYAAAVLAAEILAMADPALTEMGSDTGMFGAPAGDPVGDAAYTRVDPWLRQVAPDFASTFWRAWHAPRLAECPTLAELHDSIRPLADVTPLPVSTPAPPPTVEVPRHGNVTWSRPEQAARPVPPRPPTQSAPPPSSSNVNWNGTEPAPAKSPAQAPRAPRASGGGDIPIWLILALAAVFVALLVLVASAQ